MESHMDAFAEKIQASTYERVRSIMDESRWGANALPRLTLKQLRLLANTLIDAYTAGYWAGQLRERVQNRVKSAQEFFQLLEGGEASLHSQPDTQGASAAAADKKDNP